MKTFEEYLEAASDKPKKLSKKERYAQMDAALNKPTTGKVNKDIKAAIEIHTGKTFRNVEVIPDPEVYGTYAVAAGPPKMQFLIIKIANAKTIRDIYNAIEDDVKFDTWPPKSGSLKFF